MSPARAQRTGHLDEDRLIDLAGGLLPAEESRPALRHLRECIDCEKQFRTVAIEWERVRMNDEPVRIDGRLELAPQPSARATRRGRRPLLPILVAGTIAAGLLLAVLLVPAPTLDAPIPWRLPVDQTYLRARADAAADGAGNLATALDAYRRGRPERAVELLSAAQVPERYEALREIYLASALILDNRPGEAEPVLERLEVESLPPPWRQMAQWLVYVTVEERGETERAAALLEQLVDAPGEVGEVARAERERR